MVIRSLRGLQQEGYAVMNVGLDERAEGLTSARNKYIGCIRPTIPNQPKLTCSYEVVHSLRSYSKSMNFNCHFFTAVLGRRVQEQP